MIKLRDAGVDSPRRDALVLLEDTIRKDRAWVLAHHDFKLSMTNINAVDKLIERRLKREPLAYIRRKAWFYGRFFAVNKKVLIPRPESETFIDQLKIIEPLEVIDIGTGSGVLAITAALELPNARVVATDTDSTALALAQKNATNHNVDIEFLLGSLLKPLQGRNLDQSIIITNLPYVPAKLITSPEICHEPPQALFSGPDGLDHYREFWKQVSKLNHKPQIILTEALESQHRAMIELANTAGYSIDRTAILVQVFVKA